MSTPDNPSYLTSGISKLSPWSGRNPAAAARSSQAVEMESGAGESATAGRALKQQRGGDHRVSHRHRLSLRNYPRDCPPLLVQWFFAVDVPKRKPSPIEQPAKEQEKPKTAPKKYAAFSKSDSRAIEGAFQKLADEEDAAERRNWKEQDDVNVHGAPPLDRSRGKTNVSLQEDEDSLEPGPIKVPVNEDYLFDVDIERRELAPAYWLGPIYEVRRGTWFYQDSSVQRPCDENLAAQLEEGYVKIKPWRFVKEEPPRSASQPRSRPTSGIFSAADIVKGAKAAQSASVTPKASSSDLRADQASPKDTAEVKTEAPQAPSRPNTHRLFGPHSHSVVTYQDANTAWILTDDFLSRMSSTMYKRFAGGGHYAGVKVTRGYTDASKKAEEKDNKSETPTKTSGSTTPDAKAGDGLDVEQNQPNRPSLDEAASPTSESHRLTLERQMSSLMDAAGTTDPEKQEEEVRKRDEKEIQDDYQNQDGQEQNREIEHLLLVTHGIGQRLGLRMESVNFVHDVNTFRKTLKSVYNESPDLQALNSEVERLPKNCRVQVLPINWRHKLGFPKQGLRHNRGEHDLGASGFDEEYDYPNLDDISVEGVPAVRNLITDLALDILLYQSPAYKDHISRIVLEECNRIYKLFRERNPSFDGKVSFVGHSLGSAIMFDILCMQEKKPESEQQQQQQQQQHQQKGSGSGTHQRKSKPSMKLDFEVEDFYALGSPIGLFQMLKGRTVAARKPFFSRQNSSELSGGASRAAGVSAASDAFLDSAPLGGSSASSKIKESMGTTNSEIPSSAPLCKQFYNIFHPTDPVAYRIEPLISPAMASLKPQPLPYTKRGIFQSSAQGLTGIGARVGQSVSGLWSSFSTGIASSLLNRSLGFTSEDASKLGGPSSSTQSRVPLSMGAGTSVGAGVGPTTVLPPGHHIDKLEGASSKGRVAERAGEPGQHPATLIDAELETLYAGFESQRKNAQADPAAAKEVPSEEKKGEWAEAEGRGRKLRKEEAKVRALNTNGRVDYAIQEGAFDISLIAAVASHLTYWADEDVNHFMISQLLSRQRVVRQSRSVQKLTE